jgi:hypothetical protein
MYKIEIENAQLYSWEKMANIQNIEMHNAKFDNNFSECDQEELEINQGRRNPTFKSNTEKFPQ